MLIAIALAGGVAVIGWILVSAGPRATELRIDAESRSHAKDLNSRIERLADDAAMSTDGLRHDELVNVVHGSLDAMLRASFDDLVALLQAKGLRPDSEIAEMIRADFSRRPATHRPAGLSDMSHAELVALRTSDKSSEWKSFDPRTLGITIVPAKPDDGNVIVAGSAERIQHMVASGCSGKCVRAEMPYVSDFARELERRNAVARAYIGVEGTTAKGQRVYLMISYSMLPDVGWTPRSVTAITLSGEGLYTPRVQGPIRVPTLAS